MTKEELLKNLDEVLEEEGLSNPDLTNEEKLNDFILPSLEQSKATLANLYKFEPKNGKGILRKIKYKILSKIKNVTINVVERESMRQQRFNELTYQAIKILVEENEMLKEKIKEKGKVKD